MMSLNTTPCALRPLALAATLVVVGLSGLSDVALAQEAAAAAPAAAPAATPEARATLQALIDTLVQQGLLSRARAEEILRQGRAPGDVSTGVVDGKPVLRVPYLPEGARQRIKEELRTEVMDSARAQGWAQPGQLPEWLRRIEFSGDVRVRAQFDGLDDDNVAPEFFRAQSTAPSWAPDLTNTRNDRQRLTLRARLGVESQVDPDWRAGLRLGTGSASASPSASSQTLGGSDAKDFGRMSLSLDRAWLRWTPVRGSRVDAGRMEVPFERSDLIWADDVSVDGMALRQDFNLGALGMSGFASAGVFPLEEFANTARDKTLLGAQLGMNWAPSSQWRMRAALAVYNFRNIEGVRESDAAPTGALAGTTGYQSSQYPSAVRQKGNTLINLNPASSTSTTPVWGLASKFRPVNLNLGANLSVGAAYELGLNLDVVKNTGFDAADIARRAGTTLSDLKNKTLGYQLRASLGKPALLEQGDWSAFVAWRHFERDAWVDAFTDTTWHLGGTNYQGFSVGGQLAVAPRVSLGARLTSTRNLDDGVRFLATESADSLSGNMSSAPLRINVFQLDATLRF